MTINNWTAFHAGHWDYACLAGCFGHTKISPTDVDGAVHIFNRHTGADHFLTIETKAPDAPLPTAQRRLFEARQRSGRDTIMVIWGHPQRPEKMLIYYPTQQTRTIPADLSVLRAQIARWYRYATAR